MAEYSDTFTAANGTLVSDRLSDSGHAYTANTSYIIDTNRAYTDLSGAILSEVLAYTTPLLWSMTLNFHSFSDVGNFGYYVCADATGQNGYLIRVNTGFDLELWKVTGGALAIQFDVNLAPAITPPEDLLAIRIEATATHINVYYNEVLQIAYADTDYARNGKLFLRCNVGVTTSTGYHLSSVSVVDDLTVNIDVIPHDIAITHPQALITTPGLTNIDVIPHEIAITHDLASINTGSATPPYPVGVYPLFVEATAPDTSTDTDTGTLTVYDPNIPVTAHSIGISHPTATVLLSNVYISVIPHEIGIAHLDSIITTGDAVDFNGVILTPRDNPYALIESA